MARVTTRAVNLVVVVESYTSVIYLEEPDKINFHRRRASKLTMAALNPAKSADFVADLAREYQQQ
jgi:hypothetical protein